MTKHDLIFFEKRSTPKVIEQGMRFDGKPEYGKQTKRRPATEDEEKIIAKGDVWLRVDENGNKGGQDGYKKTRMKGREHLVHGDVDEAAEKALLKFLDQVAKKVTDKKDQSSNG